MANSPTNLVLVCHKPCHLMLHSQKEMSRYWQNHLGEIALRRTLSYAKQLGGETKMVMMLKYCDCCEREYWFTLRQVTLNGNTTVLKFVWRCNLCNNEIDYEKADTALDEYLDDLLTVREHITR